MGVTQGVAHHIVGVIVDVLVRGAVDVKDVGASLAGGVEPGFHLDVVVAGRPDRVHSRRLDQLMSVANFFFFFFFFIIFFFLQRQFRYYLNITKI